MDESTEDEREYVYDTNQTQTITLTIDLSATPLGPSTTLTNPDGDKQQSSNVASTNSIRSNSSTSIQFLDLPSRAPYISYKGQVFTGTWGETLGSDLIFASTSDVPDNVKPVMESRDGKWCLLGVSQTTLVAKPVELIKQSRIQAQTSAANGNSSGVLASNPDENDPGANTELRKPFTIVMPPDTDPGQRKQATFLEQLMAIKIAKGEKDIVYLGKSARYINSEGREKRGPLYSKHDWDQLNEGVTEQRPKRTKKARRVDEIQNEGLASENSQENKDGENEMNLTDRDIDHDGDENVEESQGEDEEAELENEGIDDSQIQVDSSDDDSEHDGVDE